MEDPLASDPPVIEAARRCALARAAALALVLLFAAAPALSELSRSQQMKAQYFQRLSEAIELYRKGEVKQAIERLRQVTAVTLNSFRAFYYLGLAYKADRQYLKAIEPLNFALELDPTHLQAHVDLGDCYLRRGDPEEAIAEYHRSLSIQPGYAPAWDGLGRAAEARGDDDQAVEHFRKAIDLNPGFPGSSLNLGDLYLEKGRLREAVDLFLKAIAVRPDFAAAYNRLGVAYARQRFPNEAIAALRKAAELEKGNPWHPFTIGQIEVQFGNLSQAMTSFDAAIALDENYLEAYVAKALLLRRLGHFDAARRLLEEALLRPSEDEKTLREITVLAGEMAADGEAHGRLGEKAAAGEITPDERRALAGLREKMGDFAGAAEALQPIEAEGTEADLFRLGYDLLRSGSHEEAERLFEKVRAARPASPSVLFNLGLSMQGQGKAAAAEQIFLEALKLSPEDPIVIVALGNARLLQRKMQEAADTYRKALDLPQDFPGRSRLEMLLRLLKPAGEGSPPAAVSAGAPVEGRR